MGWGEGPRDHLEVHAGQFPYIPAGMPHLPSNPSDEACIAALARTDPNEQESIVCWTSTTEGPTTTTNTATIPSSQEVHDDKHRPDN